MLLKTLMAVAITVLLILQYQLWFDGDGVQRVWHLKKTLQQQSQELEHLKQRNEMLAAEVRDLKQGLGAIEEKARSELGMIQEGETFYQVIGHP